MKGKTHDLNHDLTFFAHTINCVCHSITSMFRVLGIYNFGNVQNHTMVDHFRAIVAELDSRVQSEYNASQKSA